ncbi:PRC-barrel domain-containing protein [Natranaeroarchaeum sulfidigenes]|uniref:Protein implicated in RNA metabolism, contains PRC-barrel domain n=1 Tax=Natranaeroarchaeum sulfidigenes TaxID=2784880 RepID=A0A897MUR3_9EURY|nr:PRC-barrel domain-containing protein [Natranaeroarchaeum sulfidigenes]QSG04217.1 Protein implicated in RNA metabolism, contains PRC-barrel domain [Natranaeroarchaeum sulfidigenes]
MSDILAENLSGKAVMGTDGTELGMLYNITMDLKSGELHDVVIEPDDETSFRGSDMQTDENGRYRVPVQAVQAVKDYIVVKR